MKIFLILILSALPLWSQTVISNEAALFPPTNAFYSTTVGIRPGNGEVVTNNPPIFAWFYATNQWSGGAGVHGEGSSFVLYQTNAFQFQIATQADFGGTLAFETNTPFNFYNYLAPLVTNATRQFWWRVKYQTNGVSYFTNAIQTFSITSTASNWDRSMMADSAYHATNTHPMFGFRTGGESNVWWHATNDDARSFDDLTNAATATTNQSYFKSHTPWPTNATPDPSYAVDVAGGEQRAVDIGAVLFMWKFSGDNRWTNASMTGWLLTNLSHNATWNAHPSNNIPMKDYPQSGGTPNSLRLAIATYDWMFDYLGTNVATFNGQLRTNALQVMRLTGRYWIYNDLWAASQFTLGSVINYYDWNYANRTNYNSPWYSRTKQGSSHVDIDLNSTMIAGFVGGGDDAELQIFRDYMVNAMLARPSSFAGAAAHHVGVYGYVDNLIYARSLQSGLMLLDIAFPQVQIRRTDFCARFPEWYSRMLPFNMRKYHGAYGDGQPNGYTGSVIAGKERGYDLALLTGSGLMRQLYDLNIGYSNTVWDSSSHWDQIPARAQFSLPAATTNTTSAYYKEDGFVVASSKSPSLFDAYTNGVGFSFKAAPRGSYQHHNVADALSLDLWAYGAQITDGGGANLDDYGYVDSASPGLFINGRGVSDGAGANTKQGYSQTVQMEGYIGGFTNSGTNFVYTFGDATGSFTNGYHSLSNIVTKVRRHVLFVRSKYWVIFDEFGTRSAATFAFRWQVPWAFRYSAGAAVGSEIGFTGNRYGSNSLAWLTNGFTYTGGNYADSTVTDPQRCNVHVMFANATSTWGAFTATGTNTLGTTTTSVMGTSATNSTLNPFLNSTYATLNPDRAAGIWITNRTASTNWNFMTVIVPQQSGVASPAFSRIDDSTVVVTYDGSTETITFNPSYSASYDYCVGCSGQSVTRPRGSAIRSRAGKIKKPN